jgi:formate--tetrahydrofolate ligase
MKSDLEIAQAATMRPIVEVAAGLGIGPEELVPHGRYIAKVPASLTERLGDRPDGKLVLVTAVTPTSMGEGKTTTTIGLGQALGRIGKRAIVAIREPSLGPCMGLKGGAAGGGYSQVLPMEEINLHFTGDLHAVTAAHNLLAAVVDNHLHQKNAPEIDPRRVVWKRALDMNDRSLRQILVGLGGDGSNGVMREDGFEITAASEVMAILCLARSLPDLKARLGNVIVGFDSLRRPVLAREIGAPGAMAALLKDAMLPNLVQTIEGTPALVHGGPFANIAHGCNTLVATLLARKLSEIVVTEAGFGADLGAEKFFHIKCRLAGLKPSTAVIVATCKAIQYHGGFTEDGGLGNLGKHIENIRLFGLEPVVCLSHYPDDSPQDVARIIKYCARQGVEAVQSRHFDQGGAGATMLAEAVLRAIAANRRHKLRFLYPLEMPLERKIETIARKVYGADGVEFDRGAQKDLELLTRHGLSNLPICVAKTAMSLSDNADLRGRPSGFRVTVNELRISAGAGFVVVICGNIVTMPGLPKVPAAARIKVLPTGQATGLA